MTQVRPWQENWPWYWPLGFGMLLVAVHLLGWLLLSDFSVWGCLVPRTAAGLLGILTAPLLHADAMHLLGNLFSLVPTALLVQSVFPRVAAEVFLWGYYATGAMVWLFARPDCHIGASGVGYAMIVFCIASGFLHRERRAVALALVLLLLNQGLVWGMLPVQPQVSWESHLFGGVVGLVLAFAHRREALSMTGDAGDSTADPEDAEAALPPAVWDYRLHLPPDHGPEPQPGGRRDDSAGTRSEGGTRHG